MEERAVPQNPPQGYPRITPYLYYRDVAAAVDFAVSAFGFTERLRMKGPDGTVAHAEVDLDGGVVMMGNPGSDYRNPKQHGQRTELIYVYVDDVDGHLERAKNAGATIVSGLEDKVYGDRSYLAEDPEGHQWNFAQHVRDVSAEEVQAAATMGA